MKLKNVLSLLIPKKISLEAILLIIPWNWNRFLPWNFSKIKITLKRPIMILIIEQRITKNKFVYTCEEKRIIDQCILYKYQLWYQKKKKEQMIKYDNVT